MSKSHAPSYGFRTRESFMCHSSICETEIDDSPCIFIERCPIISVDMNSDMLVVYSKELSSTLIFNTRFLITPHHEWGVIVYINEKTKNNAYIYGTLRGASDDVDFIDMCGNIFSWSTYEVLNNKTPPASNNRRTICGSESNVQFSKLKQPSIVGTLIFLGIWQLVMFIGLMNEITIYSIFTVILGVLSSVLVMLELHSLVQSTDDTYYIVWQPKEA